MTDADTATERGDRSGLDASSNIMTALKAGYFVFFVLVILPSLVMAFTGTLLTKDDEWLPTAIDFMRYITVAFVSGLILLFVVSAVAQLCEAINVLRRRNGPQAPAQPGPNDASGAVNE